MKIFESDDFIYITIVIILSVCALSNHFLISFAVPRVDIYLMFASSIITGLITLLSIAIPINHTAKEEREAQDKILENKYKNITIYLNSELLSNQDVLMQLKDILDAPNQANKDLTEDQKVIIEMGTIRMISDELKSGLSTLKYSSLLSSGDLLTIPNQELNDCINEAYQSIQDCKLSFQRADKFFNTLLNQSDQVPAKFKEQQFREKVPLAKARVRKDLAKAIQSINDCFVEINKAIKRYGMEYKITRENCYT